MTNWWKKKNGLTRSAWWRKTFDSTGYWIWRHYEQRRLSEFDLKGKWRRLIELEKQFDGVPKEEKVINSIKMRMEELSLKWLSNMNNCWRTTNWIWKNLLRWIGNRLRRYCWRRKRKTFYSFRSDIVIWKDWVNMSRYGSRLTRIYNIFSSW
jgi:hypothetical protein